MMSFVIVLILIVNILTVRSKTWMPTLKNEGTFNEPFDYVDEKDLPSFEKFGKGYDWIGIAGTSLVDQKKAFVAFTGSRQNRDTSYSSVYTKDAGIVILCSSQLDSSQSLLGFNLDCRVLDKNDLKTGDAKYFGAVVRSVKLRNNTIAFIYCDPLWTDTLYHLNQPSGKCKLSIVNDFQNMKHLNFTLCNKYKKCLGGFSVDLISIDQDLNIIFGLPFDNSTIILNQAETNKIDKGTIHRGSFFNYGYSVAFSGNGNHFASSPVSNGSFPFVDTSYGYKILPIEQQQNYGGFGMHLDTVFIKNGLYGTVIGAPYQSKQNLPNVGAIFLACPGHKTDIIWGENKFDYFGYAVARLGDIDSDGPEEFVVSAPSLNLDKPGKIYIYKTNQDCTISKKPLQIHQSLIKGFGVAISRGFDINFNGVPDFFVSALGYSKPLLFKMPNQVRVICEWVEINKAVVYTKDDTFEVKVNFNEEKLKIFDDYLFQVAIDFLHRDQPRFNMTKTQIIGSQYIITLKALMDVQAMDLKSTPLKVAIKGTRSCKIADSNTCYGNNIPKIVWLNCENVIELSQFICAEPKCESDLNIIVKPDSKGLIIYHGEPQNYQRQLRIIISNKGPTASQLYVSIESQPGISITNFHCSSPCKKLIETEHHLKFVTKDLIEIRESEREDYKVLVDVLYKELENLTSETVLKFQVWGVNKDSNLKNNNFTLTYSTMFKPDLRLSPKKTKEMIIDSRIKPPYIENFTRIALPELGTEVKYSYIIENKGPELKNVDFKFYFPYKTSTDNIIMYIMDKVRLTSEGTLVNATPSISNKTDIVQYCKISNEMVNPMKIIGVETSGHTSRFKRSLSEQQSSETNFTFIGFPSEGDKSGYTISAGRTTIIKCNESIPGLGFIICGEVTCKLDVMQKNSEFNFDFRTWLFTKTFFDSHISDLIVTASLQANIGDVPEGIPVLQTSLLVGPQSISQKVLYNQMKIPKKALQLWPIIVAVIIGIFLLVIIIVIAYYCGFFKRKRLRKERQKIRERAYQNRDQKEELLSADS